MAISVARNRRILGRERGAARRRSAGQRVGALFDEFAPMVLAVCRYQLRDPQAAEDAAQETFLSAHRSLLGGTRPRDPAAWLATIARNECRRVRRTARTAPLDEETAQSLVDPADVVAHRADLSDVASAIADLPDRQREALVLREFCGLSYEQVAAAMSVSGSAVDSLLSRARRRLVEQLGDIPRVAHGVLVVPASLREELSRSISGLDAAGAAAGAGAGGAATIAGLGSAPVAAKVAATGAAAIVLAVPLQTLRADHGPRAGERPHAAASGGGGQLRSAGAPVARAFPVRVTRQAVSPPTRPAARANTRTVREEREHDSSGPGSGASGSGSDSSGPGPGTPASRSDSSGPGPGPSASSSSGPGPSVSGSSGSGSSGSGSSGPGPSGSGSSGSGSSSSGSGSSGSGSGSGGSGGSGGGSGSDGSGSGTPDGS